jgi:hypothetical protein
MRYLRQEHILNRLINLHLIFGIDFVGTGPSTGDVAPPVSHSRFTEQPAFSLSCDNGRCSPVAVRREGKFVVLAQPLRAQNCHFVCPVRNLSTLQGVAPR